MPVASYVSLFLLVTAFMPAQSVPLNSLTESVPSYSRVLPLKPISTWFVTFKELWLPLCQDCKNSEFFLLLWTATLVAENILFGESASCFLKSWLHLCQSTWPCHYENFPCTMDHKAGSACENETLMPVGQRLVITKLWSPFVRDVVFDVPTEENSKLN